MRSGEGGGPDSALVRGRLAAGSSASTVSDSISCEDMSGRAESFAGGRREEGGDMGARPGRATAAAVGPADQPRVRPRTCTANPEGKPQACPHKRTRVRALSRERLIQDG